MKTSTATLCKEFDLNQIGSDKSITNVGSLKSGNDTSLYWSKNPTYLQRFSKGIVLCNQNDFDKIEPKSEVTYLITTKSPRLIFAKILNEYHSKEDELVNHVADYKNRKDIRIGDFVFIGAGVEIGSGTVIHPNCTIYSNTKIGKNCVIHSGVSIATEGLGLELDPETNTNFKFPQIGGVVIHDNVEIGPGSTIRRSALDNTIIGKGTKLGAICNIGHNCIIGEECIFTCNIVTSGSSKIGDHVFMGVGSTVKQGVNIGNSATIGQGAVVVKNVPAEETWIGNPAKKIK